MVHVLQHRTFLTFNFHLLVYRNNEVVSIYTFERSFVFLAVFILYFHLFTDEIHVLLWHFKGLP